MEKVVYFFCALTSIGCAVMLFRNYRRSGARLLLWGGLCFTCLAASNIVLFVDLGLLPADTDLSDYRDGLTFLGLLFMGFGLVWEEK